MKHLLTIALMLAVSLAGCADDTAPVPTEETTAADDKVKATDTTGVIRGVVVDSAIVPIAGAVITIKSTGAEALSLEDGSFGFSELDPGNYFMQISKVGFVSVQAQAKVDAGVDKPPVVRVQLTADEAYNPFSATQIYKGLYQCGTSVLVVCGAPNIILGQGTTDDTSTPDIYVEAGAQLVQTEMVWESTQAVSPQLYFEMETIGHECTGGTFLTSARGDSPLRAQVFNDTLEEHNVGENCPIYHSVFAGDALNRAHCVPGAPCPGVGFSIQQDFSWYITEFHGYMPPEDWWFTVDGEYLPPQ